MDCLDRAILHANEVKCEEVRIDLLFSALTRKGENLVYQQQYSEAKSVYEEVYSLVAGAYYVVLEAVNFLIDVLIEIRGCGALCSYHL